MGVCGLHTPRAVTPADGGVIGRDCRNPDEEKFADASGKFPSSIQAAL